VDGAGVASSTILAASCYLRPMELLSRKRLLAVDRGRHFASEPHLRIQVLDVSNSERERNADLFRGLHWYCFPLLV
jgi:hypothetical protein